MTSGSPTVCYGALDPPVGGTFHFENLIMPPLPKTYPKMVLSDKGGSLCVKDVFAKNFLVLGEIPLAARSHRFFGNTLVKAGHLMRAERCIRHCAGSRPPRGTGTCRPDSERIKTCLIFQGFCRFVHSSDCKNMYNAAQSVLYNAAPAFSREPP